MERFDDPVTRRRTHQVHAFELIAEPQIRQPRVRDPGLPRHFERPEIRQMPEYFEPAVGEPAAGVLAEIQMLQLRHAGQVLQARIGELP